MLVFDEALKQAGDFGRYQIGLLGFIFYTTFMCGVNYYTQIFIFKAPPHQCEAPISDEECPLNCSSWTYDNDAIFPTIASKVNNNFFTFYFVSFFIFSLIGSAKTTNGRLIFIKPFGSEMFSAASFGAT